MLKTSASPSGTLEAGHTYNLDAGKARALVNSKAAVYVDKPLMEAAVRPPEPEDATVKEQPKHLGGGWYLVNGQKIKGKDAAEKLIMR